MPSATCPHAARVAARLADPAARFDSDLLAHVPGCEACRRAVADAVRTWPSAGAPSPSLIEWLADPVASPTLVTPFQAASLAEGRAADLELGPYLLLDRLDSGGMGEVFRAWHRLLLREDAVKTIRADLTTDPDAVRRFLREAESAAKLRHPHVVTVYAADQVNGRYYLAMELVPGTDLDKLVRAEGPLPVWAACEYARQAAEGLEHAFRAGLVHRDVKPANLLVTADRRTVKVADFGLARALGPIAATAFTRAGTVLGTVDYMAPEQADDSHAADARSDVYSLGCTLYYLLTGQAPFGSGGWRERLNRHAFDTPPAVRAVRPEVPLAVEAVVRRCMAKAPDERYQTPRDLAPALAEAVPSGSGAATRPDGAPVRSAAPPARGRRWVWAGAAVGALALVGVVVGVLVGGRTPEPRPTDEGSAGGTVAGGAGSAGATSPGGGATKRVPLPRAKDAGPWKFSAACGSGHSGPVQAVAFVAFLPDGSLQAGRTLGAVGARPAQLLWENWPPAGGETPASHERPTDPQHPEVPLLVTADGCYTSRFNRYEPGTLRRLEKLSDDLSGVDRGRSPAVFAMFASADGTTLIGDASADISAEPGTRRLVVLWDAKTGKVRHGWSVPTRDILRDVAADRTGSAVVTGTVEGRVLLFTRNARREWAVKYGADQTLDRVWAVAISPDGRRVYSGHGSHRVLVWDPARDEPERELPVWAPNRLLVSPDGRWLAAVGPGVKVWKLLDGVPSEEFTLADDQTISLNRVAFNAAGTRLAATGSTGVVWVWDLER
ncbi:MAG: protein kinase [Planctomycetes bacterium]|nr:protein kinase [Planctomycetota bacterium]